MKRVRHLLRSLRARVIFSFNPASFSLASVGPWLDSIKRSSVGVHQARAFECSLSAIRIPAPPVFEVLGLDSLAQYAMREIILAGSARLHCTLGQSCIPFGAGGQVSTDGGRME